MPLLAGENVYVGPGGNRGTDVHRSSRWFLH